MKLPPEEVRKLKQELPDWTVENGHLVRTFEFANFRKAVDFVNRVAEIAEEMDHHPDICVHGWNKVTLTLTTHSAGGLTRADFELARRAGRAAGEG